MGKNYILFHNYSHGLELESFLKKNGIKYTISPTPRKLSTSCGISIMYKKEDEEDIKRIIEENKINIKGFYRI
ncbi:DUF3343 domain-containing protein [Sporanaerobacter acetigenes]|uniref:Putative Se/S carrier protein-like domain-containing protein n=1 Tax=Sporanaerobacter acetigenes DSM 13106 TaxID=1123281 RepID=A0A1M5SP67_9FIRM|nr:DUF3343 domain-containing protein [Sporanaerobacter acetigenes]SHH40290.1 Protein of unknown function [Sporanaerobacter acetigenes DSM 13106]